MDTAGRLDGEGGQHLNRRLWGRVAPRHPERLVAGGRVCMALTFLLAELAEPAGLGRASLLLAAYCGYAALLAAFAWPRPALTAGLALATHAVDLAVFGAITWASGGIASPFFGFLVFVVLAATVRWGGRATLWTGVAALAVFVAAGHLAPARPLLAPDALVLRVLYGIMLAGVFAVVGANERAVREDLVRLASWTPVVDENASPVPAMLKHLARAVRVPRVVMVWEEEGEPSHHVAAWAEGRFELAHEAPGALEPLVPAPLADADFVCPDVGATPAVHWLGSGVRPWVGESVHPGLRSRFHMRSVVSPRLRGETVSGRVFCLDRRGPTPRDLAVSRIAARQTVARLELFLARERLRQTAAVEERVRLARDVHDGMLQSLTEMALLARTAGRHVGGDAGAARRAIDELETRLAATQREAREFIEQLRPGGRAGPAGRDGDLAARLADLAARLERHWGLRVELDLDRLRPPTPGDLAREAYLVIHEALINVARHAEATSARVAVRSTGACLSIAVADNGRGFAFRGRYDDRQLADAGLGPRTLRERIVAIGGHLIVESAPGGTRLEIDLPLVTG